MIPDTGEGTKRLVIGEYSVTTGGPIEEGVVIERQLAQQPAPTPTPTPTATPTPTPTPTPSATTGTGSSGTTTQAPSTTTVLPQTGGPAGVGMVGVAAVTGAAAARAWLRGRSDEEVSELRGRRGAVDDEG